MADENDVPGAAPHRRSSAGRPSLYTLDGSATDDSDDEEDGAPVVMQWVYLETGKEAVVWCCVSKGFVTRADGKKMLAPSPPTHGVMHRYPALAHELAFPTAAPTDRAKFDLVVKFIDEHCDAGGSLAKINGHVNRGLLTHRGVSLSVKKALAASSKSRQYVSALAAMPWSLKWAMMRRDAPLTRRWYVLRRRNGRVAFL
ncbi:hypothetical protein M885DRAFT_613732 [Pelagophyceae sp. CCMP2097]|nr:hypothetical protein M885DRAFT_613732 [Pelagophyceae sp. CCMP2097]